MDIRTEVTETETVILRDVDIYFGPGDSNQLTLEPDDQIEFLPNGDIRVVYAKTGEEISIYGQRIKWVSKRSRTIERLKR